MTQAVKRPQRGERLEKYFTIATAIDSMVAKLAETQDDKVAQELKEYIGEIPLLLAGDPDGYKFVMDRLKYSAAISQKISDKECHVAIALGDAVLQIEEHVKQEIQNVAGAEAVHGQTWKLSLVEQKPLVTIDVSKLAPEFLEEKVKHYACEDEIMVAVAAGLTIPGVTVERQFGIQASVIKKAAT